MNKYKVVWTPRARADLREIPKFIAKDAPRTAQAFTKRLRDHVKSLALFPLAGALVFGVNVQDVRETYFGTYRVFYTVEVSHVVIIAIYHSARLLRRDEL